MRRGLKLVAMIAASTGLVADAGAFSSGPPDGRAGDPPAGNNCTQCHTSFELNSGDGVLELSGVPATYAPETTYILTATLSDVATQMRWGFEATAISAVVDEGGALVSTDDNTQVSGTTGDGTRDYIKHTSIGTQLGSVSGTWEFEWTSPAAGSGDVDFYMAGNAANGDFTNQNDYIYTIRVTTEEAVVGVEETPAVAATILRAHPNPFRAGPLTVSFELDRDDKIGVMVLDASGRLVASIAPRAFTAGAVNVAVPTGLLRPGRYWVRAAGGFGVHTAPLTVVR